MFHQVSHFSQVLFHAEHYRLQWKRNRRIIL